jgi:hypothetical protein
MASKETDRFIVVPQRIGELVYHDVTRMEQEIGPLWKYMDGEMVPEADVTVFVREVKGHISEDLKAGPSVHKHEVNQLYCLVGDVKVEVTLEADKHMVQAPAAILIPAGMNHAIKFGGKGYLVNVFSGASYR